jgi:hypothetical protein
MGVIIKSSLVLALILYFISGTLYVLGGKKEVQTLFLAAKVAALGGALANLTALVLRTMMTGRLPLTDGYEFLLLFPRDQSYRLIQTYSSSSF